MIDWKAIKEYRMYADEDECYYSEEYGTLVITHGEKQYFCPPAEDTSTFLDRIQRSRRANRNLFYDEWKQTK